jgi:hypothetical protein
LESLGTLYCENCIRNYLKAEFPNWTTGNIDVDNLIRKCQMETIAPNIVIKWIPYNNLKNIKYLTKGGFSEIYSAEWVDGSYNKWDSKQQLLKGKGTHKVVLKKLECSDSNWLDEVL